MFVNKQTNQKTKDPPFIKFAPNHPFDWSNPQQGTYLKWLLILESLFIGGQVPKGRGGKTCVGLLDASEVIHFLHCLLDVIFNVLDDFGVRSLALSIMDYFLRHNGSDGGNARRKISFLTF